MATAEILAENEVTTPTLDELFKQAFFQTTVDSDGDLIVQSDGPRVIVTVDEQKKLVKFMAVYGLKEAAALEHKLALVNRMNDEIIYVRFSVPRDDILVADYFLLFQEGIPAFQLVSSLRLFARVVPAAIRACDQQDLVE